MRSYCEEHKDSSSKRALEDDSSKKDRISSSKDLCDGKTVGENKGSAGAGGKKKDVTFIVIQKKT